MNNPLPTIDITYRGPLESCNYDCDYCPFSKTHDDALKREQDRLALGKFLSWVDSQREKYRFRILFTPWGEALIRKWYRVAMLELSWMEHVEKVVMQTNLSSPTQWLEKGDSLKIALWTTFHPDEVTLDKFVIQTQRLDALGISYSVGIVGTKENRPLARALRKKLNVATYLWVNAYKDQKNYYDTQDIECFYDIDPLFLINNSNYPSLGKICRAASTAISVNGAGDVMPCNFVDKTLGNIYQQELSSILLNRFSCPNELCDCYIGYIHLPSLELDKVYTKRILERIPASYSFTGSIKT